MRTRYLKGITLFLLLAAIHLGTADAQTVSLSDGNIDEPNVTTVASCETLRAPVPVKQALRPVCLRTHTAEDNITIRNAIIIGFVGGFVKHDDWKHPEVHFADLLRQNNPRSVHAEVFANRDGGRALRRVLELLNTDEDGTVSTIEKEQANIIIYGHSWGASQAVTLARELGRRGIPVLLTIQVDSVRKLRQNDSTIPPNVRNAVNFYQTSGLIHGRSMIRAADPGRTNILGNFRMTYGHHQINCKNYPWLVRVFNRPHHEIENDPLVWGQAAALIDSELASGLPTAQASSPSRSARLK
jgi:hypothetical protein